MISRRGIIAGLLAMPAICHPSSLMALRGEKLDWLVRVQSWKPGIEPVGFWEVFEGLRSKIPSSLRNGYYLEPRFPPLGTIEAIINSGGRTDPHAPLLPSDSLALLKAERWIVGVRSGAPMKDGGIAADPNWWTPVPVETPNVPFESAEQYRARTEMMQSDLKKLAVWGQ